MRRRSAVLLALALALAGCVEPDDADDDAELATLTARVRDLDVQVRAGRGELADLERAVDERHAFMERLLGDDPAAFVAAAQRNRITAPLPAPLADRVERPARLRGRLEVRIEDADTGSRTRLFVRVGDGTAVELRGGDAH